MEEKVYQNNQRDNRIVRVSRRIGDAFKALWIGEGTKKKEPVDEKAKARFDDVVKMVEERENSYRQGLKADGNMGSIKRARESRENPVKQQTLLQYRADD